ncbi:MAG: NAD-binding protein [Gammaproteobacteria bacterium]
MGNDELRPPSRRRWRQLSHTVWALWPQWPLAAALVLSGALNIMGGLRYHLTALNTVATFNGVGQALSALGSTTQVILGITLVVVGIGLVWRLHTAWAFGVLLLIVTVGVNAVRHQWGPSLLVPGVLLLAMLALRNHFTHRTVLANYLISTVSILAILAYGSVGAYLLGSGFRPRITDLQSGLYFTIVSLSTVGYGDIVPVSGEARMFVVSLLVAGLSIFATAIASSLGPVISGELARIFTPKGRTMKPHDHVILVGEGPIACNTARELTERGVPFVQVVAAGAVPPMPDKAAVTGDSSEDAVLLEAGIDKARMVIAARDDDGDNAFIALAAKDLNAAVRVLAVAGSARSIRRLKLARADLVFAPVVVGSRLLADLIEGGAIPDEFHDLLEGQSHTP